MILHKFRTSEAIARFLLMANCKGERRNLEACPMGGYISRLYPHAVRVVSGMGSVDVWFSEDVSIEIKNTEAMNRFVEEFDKQMFPALIK